MRKESEIQKENIEKLLDLIEKNPELPILPMVDSEVVHDDYCTYWAASWGKARIDSYCFSNERIWFLSDDRDEIFDAFYSMPIDLSAEQEEIFIENAVSSLPWKKAIIVNIESIT